MPVLNRDRELLGAITLVGTNEALVASGQARLAALIRETVYRLDAALP
jgi:DNA-binding IclR family transcriptional regulator